VIEDVKVTCVPEQTGLAEAVMVIETRQSPENVATPNV
jgi:hypothetical protein